LGAFAHSYGPAPRLTAAPGDNSRACTACHAGAALNSGQGSVKILLQGGAFYSPGVKQRIAVQVSDPNQRRWGFELSARLNSNPETAQAGSFTPVDNLTQVICEDGGPLPCATGVSFIQHTSAGSRNGQRNGAIFQFDWTPPSTNAGPVTFYVAGNAANGDGTNTGDLIYTSNLQLTPVTPAAPTTTAGSVLGAASGVAGAVSPNSWVTIYGTNLSATTRSWTEGDFVNGGIPFSLDGVSVILTQFGAPRLAYVGYVSPTQVNFLLPSDLNTTTTTVQVRNPAGITTAIPLPLAANAPQLFPVAAHANGTLVNKTAPATPGEVISLFGTGLGAVTPALIPGVVPTDASPLATPPTVTCGGNPATVNAAVVLPGAAGVYQVNVQIPSDATSGDQPVVLRTGTANSAPVTLAVQK
jgi:uncharacterized protein (TIGR03437 family)